MTVSYSDTISSSQGGVFIKILLLWKGSLYKLVYTDLLAYLFIYYVFNMSYRMFMSPEARQHFELVVKFCNEMDKNIPLSFILGFFVAGVIGRWWEMYLNIPWLNRISFCCYGVITGTKDTFEVARQIRCSLMRYMNLAWILLMHSISEKIVHRFSNTEEKTNQSSLSRLRYLLIRMAGMNQLSAELRAAKPSENKGVKTLLENINKCPRVQLYFRKLATQGEIDAFVRTESEYKVKYQKKYVPEYWLPLQWAALLSKKAMIHGYCDPRSMVMIMREIEHVRCMMHTLNVYNDVMIPLVYTQVVIIAVYSYFLLQLFSQQFVNPKLTVELMTARTNATVLPIAISSGGSTSGDVIDMYFPVFAVFQFLFLMGWLKVAMCVMNPFGDDDEDFHTSEILDYNLEISSRCVEGQSAPYYPEGLSEPSMEWLKKSAGSEGDNMQEYLAAAELEFGVVQPPPPEDSLRPFVLTGRTRRERLRHRIVASTCCGNDGDSEGLVDRRRRQQPPESP